MKLLATSDLHGNIHQYKKLLEYIENHKDIEAVFIDGDLAIRRSKLRDAYIAKIEKEEKREVTPNEKKEIESVKVVDMQYNWFVDVFFPLMKNCKIPIYMNMGNADYRINLERLREFFAKNKNIADITILENDKIIPIENIKEELYIYSLSNVNLSNHRNKDWENVDMKKDIEVITDFYTKNPNTSKIEAQYIKFNGVTRKILLQGLKSKNINEQKILVNEDVSLLPEDTLEVILENFENNVSSDILSKTICLMHGPPYDTPLDIIRTREHVGSIALKNFLNKNKPLLSIHGHIHESVLMSNQFLVDNSDSDRNSISVSIGNDFKSKNFSIVVIDTNDLLNAKRYNI
ncbi:Metallo-dependent phosphatase [Anaeromyces robustus]|uniref:Metallo-dependent phosphatase n=1 Tax=Anaeromyces robustus TaxID=1754192 RepID=A0A1Y1XF13_9FUNG|nr:Metallo-dependent phosphatase [Anaeromyces robustus]|eukprot:ORX84371.1 Metallo-dependent phosphatase [Anaeromyces robustus]